MIDMGDQKDFKRYEKATESEIGEEERKLIMTKGLSVMANKIADKRLYDRIEKIIKISEYIIKAQKERLKAEKEMNEIVSEGVLR